jgi:acetyl-CoA carboxylase carboxyl transferase subunit beta
LKEIFKRHPRYKSAPEDFSSLPDDLWVRCPRCKELLYAKEHEQALKVCPKCKFHSGLSARERVESLLDAGTFVELDALVRSVDPLGFTSPGESYGEKLGEYAQRADTQESFIYGSGQIDAQDVVFGATEFKFAGGSMGAAFGEKLVRAIELAQEKHVPLIVVSRGGGARMHEGAISLLQMAKTVAALDRFKSAGLPFISIMVDPCLGGITASYAMLGDVNLAEPGAYIGFAGRRVIQETMRQNLPQDAATAEFLQKHGMVDQIVPRSELPGVVARLVRMLATENPTVQAKRRVEYHAGV